MARVAYQETVPWSREWTCLGTARWLLLMHRDTLEGHQILLARMEDEGLVAIGGDCDYRDYISRISVSMPLPTK